MTSLDSAAARSYRDAPIPDGRTPWREAIYSVVDLELTGLDPSVHEIVSFAVVTIADGRIRLADTLYRIVRPVRMPDADTIRIHGLRESDLAGAPTLDRLLDELIEAITGRVLVAHVASVEEGFLRPALERRGLSLRNPVVDTAGLGEELYRLRREPRPRGPGGAGSGGAVSSPGLSVLSRSLGLPVHRPHHADGDALTTAQLFLALANHLEAFEEPLTLRSLVRMSGRTGGYRKPSAIRRLLERLGM